MAVRRAVAALGLAALVLGACTGAPQPAADGGRPLTMGPPLGIAWGFLYGYQGTPALTFLPQVRDLGGGWTKLYVFWNQIEPQRGRYDWTAVDAFLGQLRTPEEGLIAVFSSSTWATRVPVDLLPPSPARDPADYERFVGALVAHCRGRVRYWQNDSEPNNPLYWSGTAAEFVAQLAVFHRAVKAADPSALVVAGGYDGLFDPDGFVPGQDQGLAFFDTVLRDGRASFDIFDLRLYADPYTIPARVAFMRRKMADLGYERPIISTESNGPGFMEFVANRAHVGLLLEWTRSIADTKDGPPRLSKKAEEGVAALYARRSELPPATQMFLQGAPPELEARLQRLQCRDLVVRNVMALAAGVQRTMFWDLWHDTSKRDDVMTLLFGKLKLMEYQEGRLQERQPLAGAYRRMSAALAGVTLVRRRDTPDRPTVYAYDVERAGRPLLLVAWDRREPLWGETLPPVALELPWPAPGARAVDVLGQAVPAPVRDGRLRLMVSANPVFVEAESAP